MEKNTTICFKTTPEMNNALNRVAEDEKRSVSEVVDDIITHYLTDRNVFQVRKRDRRRYERKKVNLSAHIGDPRWQRCDFQAIKMVDISIGGVGFVVPQGAKREILKNSDSTMDKIIMIFRLPTHYWPVSVQIAPQRILEYTDEIMVGATLVNPDFHAYSALQKYMM